MLMDFPVTRRMLISVADWFILLVQPFLPLKKVPLDDGFHWDFEEHSARTVILGKVVRIISGLRGAMILADLGYVTECSTILRIIDDFIFEIEFLVDGCGSHEPPKGYEQFIKQYFDPMPTNSDEYAAQGKNRWVARDQILEGFVRSTQRLTKDSDKVRKAARFVSYAYDKYVHGGYLTAMELYREKTNQFMLAGHDGDLEREFTKRMVAGRLFQSLAAFVKVASLFGNDAAVRNFHAGGIAVSNSGELP
jgi:hypothetical protein